MGSDLQFNELHKDDLKKYLLLLKLNNYSYISILYSLWFNLNFFAL